jgi:hypothetical protein
MSMANKKGRLRPGEVEAVFLLAFLAVVPSWRRGLLDDPALGRHLRGPDAILTARAWPTTDPFLAEDGPAARPWLDTQWLAEGALWLGERWAGLEGVAAVATLPIAAALAGLYLILRRDGRSWAAALFWTVLAALGTTGHWVAQPILFAWPLTLLTMRLCAPVGNAPRTRRRPFLLVPILMVWANTDPTFVLGFLLVAAAFLTECARGVGGSSPEEREQARHRATQLVLIFGASVLVTLVNPYGVRLHLRLFRMWNDPFLSSFRDVPSFTDGSNWRTGFFLLALPLFAGMTRRRPSPVELVLCVLLMGAALTIVAAGPLFVLGVAPLLARAATALSWPKVGTDSPEGTDEPPDLALRGPLRTCLLTGLLGLGLVGLSRGVQGRQARLDPERIPTATLDRLLEWRRLHPEGKVVHQAEWGGYLTWRGWPSFTPTIDDRPELQGPVRFAQYQALLRADPAQLSRLEQGNVEVVCIRADTPLAAHLARDPEWEPLQQRGSEPGKADNAVIFVRVEPEPGPAPIRSARVAKAAE